LELNPLPGILPNPQSHSGFPTAAAAAHLSYAALIRRVLAHACQRYRLPLPAPHPNPCRGERGRQHRRSRG
jgi:D-alanine-D-alanine ligase